MWMHSSSLHLYELCHARSVLCMPQRRLPLLASLSKICSAASVPAAALLVNHQLDRVHQCVLVEQTSTLFKSRGHAPGLRAAGIANVRTAVTTIAAPIMTPIGASTLPGFTPSSASAAISMPTSALARTSGLWRRPGRPWPQGVPFSKALAADGAAGPLKGACARCSVMPLLPLLPLRASAAWEEFLNAACLLITSTCNKLNLARDANLTQHHSVQTQLLRLTAPNAGSEGGYKRLVGALAHNSTASLSSHLAQGG